MVQIKASEAWIQYKMGNNDKALELMRAAADMEDAMEKHPVTPGSVIPARELLGDMLLEMHKPSLALEAFESDLKRILTGVTGSMARPLLPELNNVRHHLNS